MRNKCSVLLLILGLTVSGAVLAREDGLVTLKSKYSVKQTLDKLSDVLTEKGVTIMARISHTDGAKKAKLSLRPTVLLIFGNPVLGSPLMQSNQTVGIDLPMKALAWQDKKGQVWLTYNDPAYFARRHGVGDRDAVILKMSNALKKFAAVATGTQ
ncbi:MAG: DUF302 domain-containing protein [Gammaproteobacteria bacterium]|nr:DUF302 domain-containing protein [Gammaproteobacteria bacterium]